MFYIPGYDPFHPRRYRELYRREGAAQALLSGYALQIAPLSGKGAYGWQVTAEMEGKEVAADIEVLVWSDIVRSSMGHGIAATYVQLVRTAWVYLSSGALFRLMRLRKGPIIAALYPIGMLLAQALVALAAGGLAAILVRMAAQAAGTGLAGAVLGIFAGLGSAVAVLRAFRRADNRLYAHYLMHDYSYSARWNGANPPDLEARLRDFAERVGAALRPDVDEVLVVGHSSGAHLAVSILADLVRAGRVPRARPALSLLTLGQVIPMVSFLPAADRLRADLNLLAGDSGVAWVDVTAPGDGCSFALCDPVAVTGVAPAGKRWPLILSAAFSQTLSAARWRELRWRFFNLHFQYLCAFDSLPGRRDDYDYFRITAGPLTLGDRYAARAPSRSRIERPASGYRTMAA